MHPNLIIAGSQKCGTTSLCDYLSKHTDCLVAQPKEPAFFSRAANLTDMHAYEHFFAHGYGRDLKVIADATTEYMINPLVPERLQKSLSGNLKFLFMIRDPGKRAFAAYTHLAKRGHEKRAPEDIFSMLSGDYSAVAAEEEKQIHLASALRQISTERYRRDYDDEYWPFRYVANSFYSKDIQRYASLFGNSSIMVLVFEEFLQSPEVVGKRLADFLGIDPSGLPDALPHSNPTLVQDVNPIKYALRSMVGKVMPSMVPRLAPVDRSTLRLKPTPEILDNLSCVFESERDHWSNYFRRDMRELGWS